MAEWIGIGLSIIGTAVGVASSISQAQAQKQQGKTAFDVSQYNAAVARNEAIAARQAATAEAEREREKGRRFLAAQRAATGASGITAEGSPLLVMLDTAAQSELDALTRLHGGELRAGGFEARARLEEFQGAQFKKAGAIGAGTTLLTGFGKAGLGLAPLFFK